MFHSRLHPSPLVPRPSRLRSARAFILLEVMLGVLIFAIGVLSLGRCVDNCISAEAARNEDQRARLALENRMAQIEAGEVNISQLKTDKLEGMFAGMTLKQSRKPLGAKNEKNEPLNGLYQVEVEANWMSGKEPQSKKLSFYVLRSR
jgi:type II secretory pathway component PulJ